MVNANVFIASGVSLLALTAGVFLLSRATKDNLGLIYKIVAWFIIIGSIINAGCNAMNCMFRLYHRHMMGHEMKMGHEVEMKKMFMHHNMWSRSASQRGGDDGKCSEGNMMCGGEMCAPDRDGYCRKCCEGTGDSCSRPAYKMNK